MPSPTASRIQQTLIKDGKRKWGHAVSGKLVRASLGMSVKRDWQLSVFKWSLIPAVYLYTGIHLPPTVGNSMAVLQQ